MPKSPPPDPDLSRSPAEEHRRECLDMLDRLVALGAERARAIHGAATAEHVSGRDFAALAASFDRISRSMCQVIELADKLNRVAPARRPGNTVSGSAQAEHERRLFARADGAGVPARGQSVQSPRLASDIDVSEDLAERLRKALVVRPGRSRKDH